MARFGNLLRSWAALLLFVIGLCMGPAAEAENPNHRQVLILHSYHLGYIWTGNIDESLRRVLKESHLEVDIRTEYLDWKHFSTQAQLDRQFANLKEKYRNHPFDLIITSDNKATDFAIEHRDALFPRTPIVFCGYNGFRPEVLHGASLVTGVAEVVDAPRTLDLALKLLPRTRDIWVVADGTETGRAVRQDVEAAAVPYRQNIQFHYVGEGLSTQEILSALTAVPAGAFILLGPFNQDAQGRFLDLWELADLLREHGVKAPLFHLYEEALGHGVLGGSLMSGHRQGEAAGRMAVRILHGTSPAAIPPELGPTVRKVLDFNEVQRAGIPASRIPEDCVIKNPPRSFYERNKALVLGALALSVLSVLGLSAILAVRYQKERTLRVSEARLKALIQNMPVLTCAFGPSGRVILWNRACADTMGYSALEIQGSPSAAVGLLSTSAWKRVVDLAYGLGEETTAELRLPTKDGQFRTILWSSESHRSPIQGWAGWVTGIDVTERRTAQADKARLALAVSKTVDGVMIVSGNRRITYANAAAAGIFGGRAEDLPGMLMDPFFTSSEWETLPDEIWKSVQQGEAWRGRIRGQGAHGEPIILEAAFSPVLAIGEQGFSAAVVVRDVTRQLEVEEQLRRGQRMDSLGALAGGVAHDFGNLLSTLVLRAELLEEDAANPENFSKHLDVIRRTLQRGSDLVKQLLGFARSRPSEISLVDYHAILEELRQMLDRTFPKSIRVELDLQAEAPFGEGDSGQIMQVLLNLALNARDAMAGQGDLTFATHNEPGWIHITVSDSGSGMPPEVMSRIFEPFFTTKASDKGTGMGLAMAYSLVKSHGGTIEVESQPGKGTVFHLLFPAKADSLADTGRR